MEVYARVRKWGSSLVVILPSESCRAEGIGKDDTVKISVIKVKAN